jgi:hypothetical protein
MSSISPLDNLISALEGRARQIARELNERYEHVACERYVTHFVLLHTDHIQCLRSGNFSSAYTLLKSIGRLSQRLEREEHVNRTRSERPRRRLKLREERFRRGPMVCGYVTGDFREFSPKYDTCLSKLMTYEPSILRAVSWSWSRSQRDAADVYNRLAENCNCMSPIVGADVVSVPVNS